MNWRIKIFGREIGYFDVKTKFKKLVRGVFYIQPIQKFVCYFICLYMWVVYFTSKKKFINPNNYFNLLNSNKVFFITSWHNRLFMMPFLKVYANSWKTKQNMSKSNFVTITSKHGDGRFVGIVMEIFGFKNVYGSSRDGRKSSRGIDISSMRNLIRYLKDGYILGITPDGPRGPNQKVNGEIINIASMFGAEILPTSYSSTNFIQFNSWDKFKIPLPFSRINFYFGESIKVAKKIDAESANKLESNLENAMNLAQFNSSFKN